MCNNTEGQLTIKRSYTHSQLKRRLELSARHRVGARFDVMRRGRRGIWRGGGSFPVRLSALAAAEGEAVGAPGPPAVEVTECRRAAHAAHLVARMRRCGRHEEGGAEAFCRVVPLRASVEEAGVRGGEQRLVLLQQLQPLGDLVAARRLGGERVEASNLWRARQPLVALQAAQAFVPTLEDRAARGPRVRSEKNSGLASCGTAPKATITMPPSLDGAHQPWWLHPLGEHCGRGVRAFRRHRPLRRLQQRPLPRRLEVVRHMQVAHW